ncbi:MAG: hypothetical protein MN733_35330 [Nitrososphaera sp.]|nr:hypothetical protein [Nitrososphaera sp.]
MLHENKSISTAHREFPVRQTEKSFFFTMSGIMSAADVPFVLEVFNELFNKGAVADFQLRATENDTNSNDNTLTIEGEVNLSMLRLYIEQRFSEGELHNLSSDLGLNLDSLPGEGTANKARELVDYFSRRGQILPLVDACIKARPSVSWDVFLPPT